MEADPSNAMAWVSQSGTKPWKFYFYFNDIELLSSHLDVPYHYELRSATNSITMC